MNDNYEILNNGVIKQKKIKKKIQEYNIDYINQRYNQYGEKGPQMAGLRLGNLISKIGRTPHSILDVGYGNGDFLKLCVQGIEKCYGNDITNYPLPEGVEFVDNIFNNHYDVVCFFDVLEHFEDINFIQKVNCNYIYISIPWCHNFSEEWFMKWKHRREDEHLWHFNDLSLENFFKEKNFNLIQKSNIEDIIRTSSDGYENILTCIFKKNE